MSVIFPTILIGVNAIALELLKSGIKPSRGTKDIDFAIMISSIKEYENLSDTLFDKGFNRVKAPWTFYSEKHNTVIDLLPFGEIEQQDTIQFNQRYSDLHVLGFSQVLQNPNTVELEEKLVNIPTLEGMIILKLVAWSDRPNERENDLSDILQMVEHYFQHNYDDILENHHDTFPAEGFDQLIISAEILGRKAKQFLDKSQKLSNRIFEVLDNNLGESQQSEIAKDWAKKRDWEIEYAMQLLTAFKKGITE